MTVEPLSIRDAGRAEVAAVASVLARAFHDDPVVGFIVGADRRAPRRARALWRIDTRAALRRGRVLTTAGHHGAALWFSPGRWASTDREVWTEVTAPVLLGSALPRALQVVRRAAHHHPRAPHWYLGAIGTDPERQGTGVGAALIEPILDDCDTTGVGAYLESSKLANVPYYRRFGFELTEEFEVADGILEYGMWRDPR